MTYYMLLLSHLFISKKVKSSKKIYRNYRIKPHTLQFLGLTYLNNIIIISSNPTPSSAMLDKYRWNLLYILTLAFAPVAQQDRASVS